MNDDKRPFYEDVKEKIGNRVIRSSCRPTTQNEIEKAEKLYKEGNCTHCIVYDELGYIYNTRYCYTCGICLGVI